jgi:hypothetical protein
MVTASIRLTVVTATVTGIEAVVSTRPRPIGRS